LVAAADFILEAEHREVFTDVSDWVMSDACSRLHGLHDVVHDDFEMRMNLSSRDVSQGGLRDRVSRALEHSNVDAKRICLEITESALITNPERAIRSCHDVRELGVRLAIDDFGTGHWSIRSLAQFPVDVLKLDRSLVSGLHRDDGAKRVVAGLLAFADELGMAVVAEGVEQDSELEALVELGVPRAQGFLFSRPVPLDELRSQVRSRSSWIPTDDRR
jgi:EAL domain-containing protein (putative c-di-GMP-specific phosphodiesterase class I)